MYVCMYVFHNHKKDIQSYKFLHIRGPFTFHIIQNKKTLLNQKSGLSKIINIKQ